MTVLRNINSARIEDGNPAEVFSLSRDLLSRAEEKGGGEKAVALAPNSPEAAKAKQLMQTARQVRIV
jgi:hypothetical protein